MSSANQTVRPKIVVLDGHTLSPNGDNPWDPVAAHGNLTVHSRTPPAEIVNRAQHADIVLTNKTPLDRETIECLPKLLFISVLATGFDVVDADATRELGIPVSNVPSYGPTSVGQHTFALILDLCNHTGLHNAAVRAGEWTACPDFTFWKADVVELHGRKMGIVGLGEIGHHVARIAHGFGMEIFAHGPTHKELPGLESIRWLSINDLFAEADVISLHCPLTRDNAGFVNAALLRQMKPTALLVNTARGGLVNEADIAAALASGRLAGYAADVVSVEPITADNPLLAARNCILTPHLAWSSLPARMRLTKITASNIRAFLDGHPQNVVNGWP